MVARMIAEKLNGGPIGAVFVENKPGASGMIAADLLTKAPADGTTLMSATQTAYTVAPQLYKNVGFDAQRDVTGVAMLGFNPFVLCRRSLVRGDDAPGAARPGPSQAGNPQLRLRSDHAR